MVRHKFPVLSHPNAGHLQQEQQFSIHSWMDIISAVGMSTLKFHLYLILDTQ